MQQTRDATLGASLFEDERRRDLDDVALPQTGQSGCVRVGAQGGGSAVVALTLAALALLESSRPALTCIIGTRRAWIVPMISSTSIPCRYTLVVDTYECHS